MRFASILGAAAGLVATAAAQSNSSTLQVNSTFSPARPPAIPLAVKNPYLSVWLPAGSKGSGLLPGQWPSFYTFVAISKQIWWSSVNDDQGAMARLDWIHSCR